MTTVNAGDLIAPLAAVLDRLQGKITIEDAEDLVAAFGAERIGQVRPGDLITARVFNQMLVDVDDLQRRLALLEGSTTGPSLLRYEPTGTVPIGSVIALVGSGFSPGDTSRPVSVDFGGETISQFLLGSTEGRLVFTVPTSFTGLPRTVPARVQVGTQVSPALAVTIGDRAQLPQGGEVRISLASSSVSPPGNIAVGSRLTYVYTVDAQTVRPADFTFNIGFSNLNGATEADWRNLLAITPASDRIGRGTPRDVRVELTVPPNATAARILFVATTDDTVIMRDPAAVLITVGAASDAPDPRAPMRFDETAQSFNLVQPITFNGQQLQGIQVPRNVRTRIAVLLSSASRSEGTGAGFYDIDPGTVPAGWTVSISPSANAAVADGDRGVQLTVFITANPVDGVDTRLLRITANHKPTQAGASDFKSYHEFPVQIVN